VTALLVVLGAAVGAPLRYLTDLAVQSVHDSVMPWGTFAVNVAGSFVLGVVAAAVAAGGLPPSASALVGTGFCGALTTFSTFGYETVRALRDGSGLTALGNVVLSLAAGLTVFVVGWQLGTALA
jgi:CrcB protein